ncbi:MAG TPA: cobalamin-binding protein [Ktedonobacterales bacterium]|nr:cobalamin-binding protein [Ktedonobacterales bacterium]
MKIVSLLPSATEILCALGLADSLMAVTHECDYPSVVLAKPHITRSRLKPDLSSKDIDEAVRSQLESDAHSLYTIDRTLLARIAPALIITQKLCEVCAVSYDEVLDAVEELPDQPEVMNLEPMSLGEVFDDILRVGEATGRPRAAHMLVRQFEARVEAVRQTVARAKTRPRVGFLEWIDPLFCGGHWNPELIELAGGVDELGRRNQPSVRIEWEQVRELAPEVLVISCCGFSAERASEDLALLADQPGWEDLPAVRAGRVHVVDGAAYFSRPGPRLVDSLELLARLVHPALFV